MDLTKRHIIESINEPFIVEFTGEHDLCYDEQYPGMDAYECYILDDEKEPTVRAICYCDDYTGKQFLRYYDKDEDKMIRIKIHRILPIEGDDTIEETIEKADAGNGLTMGDIC
jgi:hypothetical protein